MANGGPRAERTAVRDSSGNAVSYRRLWCAARAGAADLTSRGLGPEGRVGVIADRSAGTVIAILAVLQAGAAYVAIDPAAPQDRSDAILDRAGVRHVLIGRDCLAWAGSADGPGAQSPLVSTGNPPAPAADRALAYVLFTSGSTGAPKGVMIERGSVASFVTAARDLFGITADDRVLQFSSFAFDTSVFEVFTALAAGAELHIAGQVHRKDVTALTRLLREQEITVADIPPSVLELISPSDVPGLRFIFSGGEPCSAELATRWARSRVALWHGYGPTEATVAVTAGLADEPRHTRMPLGLPIGQAAVQVLDSELAPAGLDGTGELCVGGPVVGRGYLGDPRATAVAFVPDPAAAVPGGRLYRTGDAVRRGGPGAELTFLGRRDRQVKLRGVRIEPREIEDVLRRDSRVRQAFADRFAAPGGRETLVAFVAADPGLSDGELRDRLAGWFPSWMLPDRVIVLAELPRTVTDKVDRASLDAMVWAAPAVSADALEGFTELEERVARELFAPAIGLLPERPDDDYFGLGGNSLEALKLLASVPDLFGVELTVGDFIADPTVQGMSLAIAALLADPVAVEAG
jgi:amino acid adenylation domain-containing protein